MSNIHSQLMIVKLSISQWSPRKFDKKASDEIATIHGAARAEEVGRFNKLLVESASIKPLQQANRKLRQLFYDNTAPWSDNGERVLPAEKYLEFTKLVRQQTDIIEAAADEFCNVTYPRQRHDARTRLNGLFSHEDYPDADQVRSKYRTEVKVRPLTNASDCRLWGLDKDELTRIESGIRAEQEAATKAAQDDIVQRVLARAEEMVAKISHWEKTPDGPGKKLYDSAVENLREVVQMVESGLNITGDSRLTDFAKTLGDAIETVSVEDIKTDINVRHAAKRDVAKALNKFKGVYGK